MKNIQTNAIINVVFLVAVLLSQVVQAQNKVVVVPMAGDQLPSIPHPVDDTFINNIGMQFNTLPAGSFTMGSPVDEPGRGNNEIEHTVTLTTAFGMQVTEVTNSQWDAVIVDSGLGINPSRISKQDNHPVESVTWFDAVFFANQLSLNEGRSTCYALSGLSAPPGNQISITSVTQNTNCTGYRLPTEAEWEYAARAGTSNAYANPISFDDSDNETSSGFNGNLHAMGWYSYNREMQSDSGEAAYENGTKPVAKKQTNAWGLYDMHGNVSEWNGDFIAAYSGNAETDPTGPLSGSLRVFRGGSWIDSAFILRSANRAGASPSSHSNALGFRLVLAPIQ